MTAAFTAGAIDAGIPPSATLALNERIARRMADGAPILHLAFGEAGIPVLPTVAEVLARAAPRAGYGPVAGANDARAAAAGWFERRGLPTAPDQILLAPGSKPLLYALLSVLPGDVVLPKPAWVSYAAHAALAGKRAIGVPIGPAAGGAPDPAALEAALAAARTDGLQPGVLVLTLPDNPTGTQPASAVVADVCRVAEAHGLLVVSDEIYRDLVHDPDAFASPTDHLPERTFVTSGLSKNMALGGWRIGYVRVADGPLGAQARDALTRFAGAAWSALAAPMQHVAAHVLAEPDDVRERIARSRGLHRRVAAAAHAVVADAGIDCRPPSGAFYLYPDLERRRGALAALGVTTGSQLAEHLLERHDISVLAGAAFGDDASALRVRIATTALYGAHEDERLRALASDDPAGLPWIRAGLDRVRAALRALA